MKHLSKNTDHNPQGNQWAWTRIFRFIYTLREAHANITMLKTVIQIN